MAKAIKINSTRGVVSFTEQDMIENNLIRYVRTSMKGIHNQSFIDTHPFESVASDVFKQEYPSDQINLSENCIIKHSKTGDLEVDVILIISEDRSDSYFAKNNNTLVFNKEESSRG